jgi:GIY-YIG catalytic domain
MVYIYVLQLEHGKYYVGKTTQPNVRLDAHSQGAGSTWTKMHKPIKLLRLIPDCDDYDEDKYTRFYMDKYGIENVRGGSFVTPTLAENLYWYLVPIQISTYGNLSVSKKQID